MAACPYAGPARHVVHSARPPKTRKRDEGDRGGRCQSTPSVAITRERGRRGVLTGAAWCMAAAGWSREPALAVSSGSAVSRAWSAVSGAPADLTFPEAFLGTWIVASTLTQVDKPHGEALVPDSMDVEQARAHIGTQVAYPMRFVRNGRGEVVMDRAFNAVAMASVMASSARDAVGNVRWDVDDPNVLRATLGDGRAAFVRVTQRSEAFPAPDRIETSEVAEGVYDPGAGREGDGGEEDGSLMRASVAAKVTSTRTFTKWKFRDPSAAGEGPAIVASQNVYGFLTALDPDASDAFLQARGQPVTHFTYRLALFPATRDGL